MGTVNQGLRNLWNVEIDLLEKFKSICEKYNLNYFATAGTLLGAVRHQGFIPWDDDIDVCLLWPDYKRFLEVAPDECKYPYFFQSFLTEIDGEVNGSRLRRSDTTGFTKWEYENVGPDYDKGIFIDIFPIFNVPDQLRDREYQKKRVLFFWKCIRGHDALMQIKRGREPNILYVPFIKLYKRISKIMNIVQLKWAYLNACGMVDQPTREVGATASRVHLPKMMWDAGWFETYIELPFENTTIRCPSKYEKILEKQYGDWKTPVINGAVHEMVAVDTETPWKLFDMTTIV